MKNNDILEIEQKIEDSLKEKNYIDLISNSDDFKENKCENNKDEIINNDINDSLKLYENQDSKSNYFQGSEEIFINQKIEIEKLKKRNELFHSKKESKSNSILNTKNNFNNNIINENRSSNDLNNNIQKETEENNNEFIINNLENLNNEINFIKTISLKDYKSFEYYIFNNNDNSNASEVLDIESNKWTIYDDTFPFSFQEDTLKNSYTFIELNQLALRVIQEIDYEEMGLELNLNFNLAEKSELWIFTRCFVNKAINESCYFDEKSENININDIFNKYTSLIKIIKESNSNRCFVTFGTFYNEINDNNNVHYKTFLKRQLIDYSLDDKLNYKNEDKSEFNAIINDLGEETININIFLNNKIKSNEINGNLFLPINKKAKILICGKGQSVELKEFIIKTFDKRKNDLKNNTQFELENDTLKNCECCSIS